MSELDGRLKAKRTAKFLVVALSVILSVFGSVSVILTSLPYPVLKGIADELAPDKNLRLLTPGVAAFWHYPLLAAAILSLFCGAVLIFRPRYSEELLRKILLHSLDIFQLFLKDAGLLLSDVRKTRPARLDLYILGWIVALGAGLRLMLINRPIEFDEAYTFIEFARYSFRQVLTDYSVPNNHVFHSLLVRIAYLLLGENVWQLRFPSFLASLVLIVCVYFLGRNLYDRKTGLLAALLAAVTPIIVFRSVAARGYMIMSLMVILAFLAGDYVSRKRNLFGWFLLALFSALGFYTIPVMLYPYGLIFAWLFFTGWNKNTVNEYTRVSNWFMHLGVFALLTALLTLLFYSPILLNNNLLLIYKRNTVLQPKDLGAFLGSVSGTLGRIGVEWTAGIAGLLLIVLAVGLFLSILGHKAFSKNPVVLQVIFIVYIGVVVLALRPDSITRIWLWITPLLALWSAAGLVGGVGWLAQKMSAPDLSRYVLALLFLGFVVNGCSSIYAAMVTQSIVEDPVVEQVTLALRPQITERDIVLVSDCASPRYWYYFSLDGIPEDTIRFVKNRPFERAFVIAYTGQDAKGCKTESMEDVIKKESSSYSLFNLSTLRIFTRVDYVTVYEIDSYPAPIKAAGSQP